MGAWSGRGIPPTRRKLHRMRAALLKERKNGTKASAAEASRWDYSWAKKTRKSITNPERFERMWCQ